MTHLSNYVGIDDGQMIVSGGLGFAIKFAEALGPKLVGEEVDVVVSGIRDGLFFHDEIRGRAVRVTMNKSAGCGRMYLGESRDFEFETKIPKDAMSPHDWQSDELSEAVDRAVKFFRSGPERAA